MFVKELLRRRKIRRNPMQNITLKKVRNRREFLEVNELEKLYSGFMEHSDRLIYANYSNRVIDREMEKFKINVPTG